MSAAVTGAARVAQLRKARGITQAALARRAGISLSLLSKIEVGDRALTPGIAAALARALRISLAALYGEAEVPENQNMLLEGLRTAVRRYDIPDQVSVPELAQLRAELDQAITLTEQAELAGPFGGRLRRQEPRRYFRQLRGFRGWTHCRGPGHRGR